MPTQQTPTDLDRIQVQLQQTQDELELTKSQLQQTQADLVQAKATIIAMESSKFWKLRKVWFSLKQALGLTNPATATALERLKFWQQTAWRSQPGWQLAGEPPIPPPHLIHFVTGSYDTSWFLKSGALAAQSIRDTLEKNGLNIDNFSSILDFGCGVGRAIRYWNRLEKTAVYGTDYNPDLIEWCKKNLTFAHFQTNNLVGRLEYENEQFDFIYALSVFTHLTEANQFFWIEELTRILQPGGYLLITTHGEPCTSHLFPEGRELFNQGQLVVYGGEQEGTNVCAAFHPQRYVREKLAKNLIVVDFITAGALGNPPQDVYLLKKPLAD
ncbi:methyltransferase domain-containing protein [Coleofasciculus chthonoplastes]|uniref:methyltransferase domain-containing protein n=1 Tax=Coleofasciculus chthonoplastes TaxID=64178 RepID=UPI004062F2CB